MSSTNIQKLVDAIEGAFNELKVSISQEQIEELAILIHETMNISMRKYHTTDHVLDVMKGGGAHHILAALFHDIVYHNVDKKFNAKIEEILTPTISIDGERLCIRKRIPSSDRSFFMVTGLFKFRTGQDITSVVGVNEYLSALVAVRVLEDHLGWKDLLTVACCIEATIPFRKPDPDGKTCFHHLEDSVRAYCKERKILIGDAEIAEEMRIAVKFANGDVGGFADPQTERFLANTWKLLPESSPSLLTPAVYTVKKYREAIEKMEGFFSNIDTKLIFHQYHGEPDDVTYHRICMRASRNVELGKMYIRGRLLSTAVLEALAEISGGDAPVVMFLGGNKYGNVEVKNEFDDRIPQICSIASLDIDPDLVRLFEYEATRGSLLDFRKSPLASYFYKSLGNQGMERAMAEAKKMFNGKVSAVDFLNFIGKPLVRPIAKACAAMISTRRHRLKEWAA